MAITRSQYLTVAELQTIMNDKSSYTNNNETLFKIYEASEQLKAHCYQWATTTDYTTVLAPNALKLATAYQVYYNDNNSGMDDEYIGSSEGFSLGKFSESKGVPGSTSKEYQKIAPKAQRYLIQGGLISRIL